ncbi:MAG: class I SAM-dependent methyltransferase [Deltaproteobacteria bacterium]|nr:class I SAM-dependent methyltransferase [Deltaproteobacteria bacterium]
MSAANDGGMNWEEFFERQVGGDLMGFIRKRWAYNLPIFQTIQRRCPQGGRVLEFGSGTGTYSAMLSHFGYRVTGVDLDPKMVSMAQRLADRLGATGTRFVQGSVLDLGDFEGQFDLAYSSGVVEHFHHPDAVEVVRQAGLCAPNVFVVVPSYWVWRKEQADTEGIFEPYTMRRLRRVVRDAGLETVEEIAFSAGNKVGRAVELLMPPMLAKPLFKHLAATIGIWARSPYFEPAS